MGARSPCPGASSWPVPDDGERHARSRSRRWSALAGRTALYFALALAAQRSLLPGLSDRIYYQGLPGNDCLLHAWTIAWDHHALATDPLHLLDANVFYPYQRTLLYSDHLLGLALLLAPLRLLTGNPLLVHNLATLAAPALDALALAALVHDLTGQAGAALMGGLLYGFAPVRFEADRCQIQVLAAWWLPLVFLWGRRALAQNRVRDALLAGGALALQGLTGIYLTAYLLPFLALAHLCWLRRFPLERHRRGWTALLAAEAAAALALLPFSLAYHRVQRDLGVSRSVVVNALLSLRLEALPASVPVVTFGLLFAAGALLRRGLPRAFREERNLFVATALGALVLALGPAVALPGGLGQVRGPYAALLALPGYDALRAPGRLVHLALLGGAVVAAGGFAAIAARLPPRSAWLAVAAVLAGGLAEYRTPWFPTIPAPVLNAIQRWVAAQPADLRYVELPVDYYLAGARYQYLTVLHWKRIANGNMGLMPPLYPYLVNKLRRFPDDDTLATLHALGLSHALVHRFVLGPDARGKLLAMRGDSHAPLEIAHAESEDVAYAIRDRGEPPSATLRGEPLDRSRWRVSASEGAARAPAAVDADPHTAWSSWADLEEDLARWYAPLPFVERWNAFLERQPARFEIDLGAPARVTAITLRLGGSDPAVAPGLVLESSLDGARWERLPGELEPVPNVRALVTHAAEARFALALGEATPARFLRLSCKGLEWRLGDVQVHAE